jgi:hypothetical protein
MKTGRIAGAALVALFGCGAALAEPCVVTNRQIYNLVSDTVNWSMRVGNSHNCLHGVRYGKVQLEKMTLVSPPRSGQVVVQGSAFTYVPKKDFQGDDWFDLEVAGQIQKVRGVSTIHIVVSVASEQPQGAKGSVPIPTPTLSGATPGPLPQFGSGPAPMPMPTRRSAGADASSSDRRVGGIAFPDAGRLRRFPYFVAADPFILGHRAAGAIAGTLNAEMRAAWPTFQARQKSLNRFGSAPYRRPCW